MKRHKKTALAALPAESGPEPGRVVTIRRRQALDLLKRLEPAPAALLLPAADGALPLEASPEERWNRSVGCKTSDVALTLLGQLVGLEHPDGNVSDAQMESAVSDAMVAFPDRPTRQ